MPSLICWSESFAVSFCSQLQLLEEPDGRFTSFLVVLSHRVPLLAVVVEESGVPKPGFVYWEDHLPEELPHVGVTSTSQHLVQIEGSFT